MRSKRCVAFPRLLTLALGALVLGGCAGEEPSLDQATDALEKLSETAQSMSNSLDVLDETKVRELAEIVSRIEKNPNEAQELLKEQGIDAKGLEDAMYRIAQDPELSKLFAEAKKAAR